MASFRLPDVSTRSRPAVAVSRQQRRAADRQASKTALPAHQIGFWRLPGSDDELVPDNRAGRRYVATTARPKAESAAVEVPKAPQRRSGLGNVRSFASPPALRKVKSPEVTDAAEAARRERRHGRWTLRHCLQKITSLRAFGKCGAVRHDGVASVNVKRTKKGNRATIGGVVNCGSVWVCPNCAATIANRRAQEVRAIMKKAIDSDYSAAMMTFTMRHRSGHKLRECWAALSGAWRLVTGGNPWLRDKATYGVFGWVKVVEVTWSPKNGWHVHLHVLVIFDRKDVSAKTAKQLGHRMWDRWAAGLGKQGFTARRDVGLDVRLATADPNSTGRLSEYFTKLAHEMTGGRNKLAKGENITPMQIGELATLEAEYWATKDDRWRKLWGVWESASKARKQMAVSKAGDSDQTLKEWAGVDELPDEDLPALFDEDGEPVPDEAALILRWDTHAKLRASPRLACDLLEAAEDGGVPAAAAWLDEHGLYWSWPPPGWCTRHNRVHCQYCDKAA